MDLFIPDSYQKSVFDINYKKLKKNGIKCILFDLDNTLVPYKTKEPTLEVKELFGVLEMDFKVIIFSNSNKKRLRPFKEKLNVDVAYSSRKPFKKKYKKVLEAYKLKESEVVCIGDQILTDIYGANKMGLKSIFVDRLNRHETLPTKFNRFFEWFILKKFKKDKILVKGEYYD